MQDIRKRDEHTARWGTPGQRGGAARRPGAAPSLVRIEGLSHRYRDVAALDRRLRERTRFELMRLQHRLGITFIMVTHDQEEAMSMSTRLAVMENGRIVQQGAPRAVYARPATPFVADFVGDANWIAARVTGRDGSRVRLGTEDGQSLVVAAGDDSGLAAGAAVRLMVRPEMIRLAPAPDGAENSLAGRVGELAVLGATAMVQVELEGGRCIEVRTGATGGAGQTPVPGAAVWLTWPVSAGLLFPA